MVQSFPRGTAAASQTPEQDTGHAPRAPGPASARRWRSAEIFGAAQEVEIEHGQAVYRLRMTSLGKLILTK